MGYEFGRCEVATVVRHAMPFSVWLKAFKEHIYELAADAPRDETDGYLNSCDFSNYYEEGCSPEDAADHDFSHWDY
jgi:hypothetical protein